MAALPAFLRTPSALRADQPATILVVEPSARASAVMVRRLSEAGYKVTAADGVTSAVAALRRGEVDLILSEMVMKPASGIDLVRLVRDSGNWRDVPVILITGHSRRGGVVEGLNAGADDVIVKPFDFDILLARIAAQLKRAAAFRALVEDKAALDARIVTKSIELGELRDRLGEREPRD